MYDTPGESLFFSHTDSLSKPTDWGTWNRTKIHSFKGCCPTVRRSPIYVVDLSILPYFVLDSKSTFLQTGIDHETPVVCLFPPYPGARAGDEIQAYAVRACEYLLRRSAFVGI